MNPLLERMRRQPIVAIVRTDTQEKGRAAARAVIEGGMTTVEITMGTPGAVALIAELARDERLLVGAGTVLDVETARLVLDAGARFVVSPVCDVPVVALARAAGAVAIPGALTPTEVLAAWRAGADLVKVFPAGSLGGPDYLRMLRGPLPQIRLVPTGGVTLDNAVAFLDAGAFVVGLTGALFQADTLARGDFAHVTALARTVVERVGARGQ